MVDPLPVLDSRWWFALLVAAVALARLVELGVSRRHQAWLEARGAVEAGAGHYPWMVVLHVGLLVASPLEVWLLDRPWIRFLGVPMLLLLVAAHALRWWVIATLGRRWTTRVLALPGAPPITSGPYRWVRHPNYLAVVVEGAALPLVHTAWVTAVVFTVLDAALLRARIGAEEAALERAGGYRRHLGARPALMPRRRAGRGGGAP